MVIQQKTHQPVQFEITEHTRTSVADSIKKTKLKNDDFLFPSRIHVMFEPFVLALSKNTPPFGKLKAI